MTIAIAHFSDLHYCAKHLDEVERCFSHAIDQAIAAGVDVAVISGDSTDHALDVHAPAVSALARQIRRLADHCPVLMLQGTYSHEPPGTLDVFSLLGGRFPVHVADRIEQVALLRDGQWHASSSWHFASVPTDSLAVFSCVPTVNKAQVSATVGAAEAAEALGAQLAAVLAGFGPSNDAARHAGVATVGVSHGTVSGCVTEHDVPMAGFDHEFSVGTLFAARTTAFLLGHIHRHQAWQQGERRIAYAGSIGRLHYGEAGEKGFLLWQVDAEAARFALQPGPARRTLELDFAGAPDVDALRERAARGEFAGACVRVRWCVAEEAAAQVDAGELRRILAQADAVKLEGQIVPVVRTRAAGIGRETSMAARIATWAETTGVDAVPLLSCLAALEAADAEAIATDMLASSDCAGSGEAAGEAPGDHRDTLLAAGAGT